MRTVLIAGAAALGLAGCGGGTSADADGDGEITSAEVAEKAEEMVKPEAGQYRATSELVELEAPGAPPQAVELMRGMMDNSFEYCLTQEEADRGFEEMARESQDSNCTFEKFDVNGSAIDAAMTCTGDGQGTMRMTMQGTGGRTSSEMTMTMVGNVAGQGEGRMVMKTSHERIGDCPA
ncbi:DUF3617 domain-containing protein [Qipengyuania sp. XHP0207]|uniref:DUF3617 domain-containing protein n=1 Tax=Qipengyuania sp. XHP0207 TaxID=3038078 RepID=UPI00241DF585|nr:DUF3617 domain-containing protein [Qipengyuania sp. XHP0207]MDG5746979.1 DUF3617 domain-containing protein [Qipengyuania sp. XHP0207]